MRNGMGDGRVVDFFCENFFDEMRELAKTTKLHI